MRTLIVTEFVSLDGVMEAPGGEPGYEHAGWVAGFFSDELGAYKQEEQLAAGILLLGRVTYDSFLGARSRTLVHLLLAEGLVDELNLQVFPLLLGSGRRLYPESADKTELELLSSSTLANGVLLQTYRPSVG